MRRHPRSLVTQQAAGELSQALVAIWERHQLTDVEYLRLVNEVASQAIDRLSRFWLREERHPESPDTPADVE